MNDEVKAIRLVSKRMNGCTHRVWQEALSTSNSWAWYIPPKSPVEEGSGRIWSSPYPVIALFWPSAYYQVFLLLKEEATEYYCNIISPVEYSPEDGILSFYDLDLDVIVANTGARLVDREEFERRKGTYRSGWADKAEEAAKWLLLQGEERKGPFTPAIAEGWRAWTDKYRIN